MWQCLWASYTFWKDSSDRFDIFFHLKWLCDKFLKLITYYGHSLYYNKGALPKLRKRGMDQKCRKRGYSGCLGLFKRMTISAWLNSFLLPSPFTSSSFLSYLGMGTGKERQM